MTVAPFLIIGVAAAFVGLLIAIGPERSRARAIHRHELVWMTWNAINVKITGNLVALSNAFTGGASALRTFSTSSWKYIGDEDQPKFENGWENAK